MKRPTQYLPALLPLLLFCLLTACRNRADADRAAAPGQAENERLVSNAAPADTLPAAETTVTGNGKVTANRYVDMTFELALPVKRVFVKNGDRVKAGQTLAVLDTYEMQNNIRQAQNALESSRLEMQDVIISQGFDPAKPAEVPERVKQLAEVKSGHKLKKTQLDAARYELTKGVIKAPFGGIIANRAMKEGMVAQPGTPVCRIIDDSRMKVSFQVMEQELSKVRKGAHVSAVPFSDNSAVFDGIVTEINPIVDERGCINVKALLQGGDGLFDGMHVKIKVE